MALEAGQDGLEERVLEHAEDRFPGGELWVAAVEVVVVVAEVAVEVAVEEPLVVAVVVVEVVLVVEDDAAAFISIATSSQ